MLKTLLLENKIKDKLVYLLDKHPEKFMLSKEEHQEFVVDYLLQIDPTPQKKYIKWMILKAFDPRSIRRVREDWEKYNEYLTLFYNNRKNPKMEKNDIMRIESWNELKEIVEPFMEPDEHDWKSVIKDLEEGIDYEIVSESPSNKLISILTQKGASYLGGDTEWCTTYGEYCLNPNHKRRTSAFPQALDQGKVYLLWSKNDDKRWQFQKESNQYMNEEDVQDFVGILKHLEDDMVIQDDVYEVLGLEGIDDFFLNFFEDSVKKGDEDNYPNKIFWFDKKGNFLSAYNNITNIFGLSYKNIWTEFEKYYSLDYGGVQELTKYFVEKYFKIEGVETVTFMDHKYLENYFK